MKLYAISNSYNLMEDYFVVYAKNHKDAIKKYCKEKYNINPKVRYDSKNNRMDFNITKSFTATELQIKPWEEFKDKVREGKTYYYFI